MIGLVSCGFIGHHFILLPEGLALQCVFLLLLFPKYSIEVSGTVPKINEIVFYFGKKIIFIKKFSILKLN